MSRIVRVALATAIITCLLPPVFAHAAPATTNAPVPAAGMHLVFQDPWVTPDGTFVMRLHIDNPKLVANPSASISIRVYESATTRNGFDQVIANGDLGNPLDQVDKLPVSLLERFRGDRVVKLGLARSDTTPSIAIGHQGVYPVEVSLVDTGVTPAPAPFVTWLVVVPSGPQPISQPLMVAPIWQVATSPATLPDGTTDPAVVAQLKPGGRLDRVAALLDHAGTMPMSLVISPETVQSWSQLAQKDPSLETGFQRVRAAAGRTGTDVLPAPYVPIDQPAFEAAGFGERLPDEINQGTETLERTLGATPSQVAFADPADNASIDRLRAMLVTKVAVRDTSLLPVVHQFTPAQGFQLDTNTGSVQAVSTAPFVEALLDGPDAAALKAQRVVAALAEVAYEEPGVPRGVVLAPAADFRPDAAWSTIVDALKSFPLVRPVTLDNLLSTISTEKNASGDAVGRRLAPLQSPPTPISPSSYDATMGRIDAFAVVVGESDPTVVEDRALLGLTLSTSISADRAQETVNRIDQGIDNFANAVTVDAKRITLTSRKATIPLSFQNDLRPARTITVRVHIDSPKLTFPKGNDQIVELQPGNTTLRDPFAVEARTSGTFPMTITLTSKDGGMHFGQPVRVTVRSAVFGGFAVALTIAALVVLALWWGNHFRRTRRARKLTAGAPE